MYYYLPNYLFGYHPLYLEATKSNQEFHLESNVSLH